MGTRPSLDAMVEGLMICRKLLELYVYGIFCYGMLLVVCSSGLPKVSTTLAVGASIHRGSVLSMMEQLKM